MLERLVWVSIVAFTLAVAGCEVESGGENIVVEEFSINGSSTELEDGRVTIDSSTSNGRFELVWKVDDDGASGYVAYFYVSINNDLTSSDTNFYNVYCSEYDDCDHDNDNDEYCWFDSDLSLVCEDNDNDAVEIDELVDTLPQDLYIIIEACNEVDCDTEVVPVRLR
jgi:hypothetical protein